MSAYDITRFLRTAYRPVVYCVPSKTSLIPVQKCGGFTLIIYLEGGFLELECQSVDLSVCERGEVYSANPSISKVLHDPKISTIRQMSK